MLKKLLNPTKFKSYMLSNIRFQYGLASLIILLFLFHNYMAVGYLSMTSDEDNHYLYGINILNGNSVRFRESTMPISAINAIPQKIAPFSPNDGLRNWLNDFKTARLMTILFSGFVAFIIFQFSRSMFGVFPAFVSLFLYTFDPNLIAHSQLVTTDIYVTGMILTSVYCLWRFANQRTWTNGLLCAFALAISQITKYTSVILFPLFLLILIIYDVRSIWALIRSKQISKFFGQILRYFGYVCIAGLISLLVINIAFDFNRTFTRFENYQFKSSLFQRFPEYFPLINRVPIPTPYPYLEGLDLVIKYDQTGQGHGLHYFFGQTRKGDGFFGYFIVASILKEPIGIQVIVITSIVAYLWSKRRRKSFLRKELFLVIPTLFFFIYFNFFFNSQIGIRYYLVIFPLVYVFAGNLFMHWDRDQVPAIQQYSLIIVLIFIVTSVFSYFPYYLSYFNELVLDRRTAYKYLADSNLDWNQGKIALEEYISKHPGAILQPDHVQSGLIVVSVNSLVGVTSPEKYVWLRENFKPVDTIAYSYLIYQITDQEFDSFCISTDYCN